MRVSSLHKTLYEKLEKFDLNAKDSGEFNDRKWAKDQSELFLHQ